MYHCHIQFYLIGCRRGVFEPIKGVPPLEHFTHTYLESTEPEAALTARADVIFALLPETDAEKALRTIASNRKKEAEVILLSDWERAMTLAEGLLEVTDVWPAPLSEDELRFRFQKWQRSYKQGKDLWESGQFLEACMNSSPNLVWYKDKEGVHEIVNEGFCRAVNKTRQQAQGRRHAYIWGVEEDDPACNESEREVMRKRETCVFEEKIHTGGGERQLTTYKSPLYDLDGSVMGTVGVAIDATRERAYEREIMEKNETLEMLFSTMDCGVIYHSMDGTRVIRINEAALRLLGYASQEELMEDGFVLVAQSVVEEDKPKLRESILSLTKVGDSTNVEYRAQHKDGEILYILGNIKLVEKDGELFYQRFLLDVTAQKLRDEEKWAQRDREIRYQEQVFEIFSTFLSDNVDDVYMLLDEKGERAEFVSPNIERVLGFSCESVIGDLTQLAHPKYLSGGEVTRESLAALEPGMALKSMETERVHRKTGEHKWFRESVYCVSVQGAKKIVSYISDRTNERLTQNALSEALDIAEVANKAKSSFLSSVSHDIRTPMNAITGLIALLREEADSPERVLEYTQRIDAASQHLLGLINDVLDMNKIESGSTLLNISEVNMAEIIDEINTIIRPQAKAKEQEFDIYAMSLSNECLLGDKLRINQILINILSNSVKYTPDGGKIKMWVNELPQMDKGFCRLRFTISDNGQGMSEEYQKVLFDPFTREQETGSNKIQGTGLGMAITKSLVDLMNGSIKVTSKLGEGSIFVVELELRIQEQEEDDPEFWKRLHLNRMIVVDDDKDICEDIVKKMIDTSVDVQYATDGARAIEMIRDAWEREEPYDLILLDWKMPDLDGVTTARLIRKIYPGEIPIMLFTAYDWVDIEKEAVEAGIENFLPKPFFMSNFKDRLQRMMDGAEKKDPAGDKKSVVDGKRVLVVDDIEVNRMILVKVLSSLGAKCDVAENGQAAVERFEKAGADGYDLIVMDIQMPLMDGYEATRAIRSKGTPEAQEVAIVAMTANAFMDDVREALAAGMDAHVSKPIVLDTLKHTIQEVFERKGK